MKNEKTQEKKPTRPDIIITVLILAVLVIGFIYIISTYLPSPQEVGEPPPPTAAIEPLSEPAPLEALELPALEDAFFIDTFPIGQKPKFNLYAENVPFSVQDSYGDSLYRDGSWRLIHRLTRGVYVMLHWTFDAPLALTGHKVMKLLVKSDGRGGRLVVSLIDTEKTIGSYWDFNALSRSEWTIIEAPLKDFTPAAESKRKPNLAAINELTIAVHPVEEKEDATVRYLLFDAIFLE